MLTPDILKDTIKTKRESIKTDLEIVTKSHIHMQNERETDRKGVRDRESERQIDRERDIYFLSTSFVLPD